MHSQPLLDGVEELADRCRGAVLWPGDGGYADACAGWNLAWTQRPAVVVRSASESDVVEAVRYATAQGLSVAVQSTGHGVTVPADEQSLLVVMSDLAAVHIDPLARTATVGGGATWTPVLAAAQQHRLAPLLGSAPHVGAVGYSVGGGLGWLSRRHGLAVDAIRSLRVVLADGQVVTTSPQQEPELFWAICGTGGGALGVVVEMTVALAAVSEVYAGNLFYPLDAAEEVFDRYVDWASQAPQELTSAFNLTTFPPLDAVPEPLRGRTFVIIRGCYEGHDTIEDGQRRVDQWRSWRAPVMDTWQTMPFARSAEISMDPVDPVPASSTGRWLHSLDRAVLEVMRDALLGGSTPSPMLLTEVRHAGGRARHPNPDVSFAARDAEWMLEMVGMHTGPGAEEELDARFARSWRRLERSLAPLSGFLNFVEGHERIQAASDAFDHHTRERLAATKRRYDPQDVFRHGITLAAHPA